MNNTIIYWKRAYTKTPLHDGPLQLSTIQIGYFHSPTKLKECMYLSVDLYVRMLFLVDEKFHRLLEATMHILFRFLSFHLFLVGFEREKNGEMYETNFLSSHSLFVFCCTRVQKMFRIRQIEISRNQKEETWE